MLALLLALAPEVREAVREADSVLLALRVEEPVMLPVPLLLCVPLPVGVPLVLWLPDLLLL